MASEDEKGEVEIKVLKAFLGLRNLKSQSISKERPPAPDLLCHYEDSSIVAYELVEICNRDLVRILNDSRPNSEGIEEAFWTSDKTNETLEKKLTRRYVTSYSIELLCYTDGAIVTTPDEIIAKIKSKLDKPNLSHPFKKVWLMDAKRVYLVSG